MPRPTDEELEQMVDLQVEAALRRSQPLPPPAAPSEIKVLAGEIRDFTAKVTEVLTRPPEVVVSPPALSTPPNTELTEALMEMSQSNRTLTAALSRPKEPVSALPPQLPPIVNVSPPTVNLSPQVTVERPTKWKFRVVARDAQRLISEIDVEVIK